MTPGFWRVVCALLIVAVAAGVLLALWLGVGAGL